MTTHFSATREDRETRPTSAATAAGGQGLATLRAGWPGCELLALIEAGTRTVLAWDGALPVSQEHLDALCDLAADLMALPCDDGTEATAAAVLVRPTGIRVFARSPAVPEEVLCAVFAPDARIDGVARAGRAWLLGTFDSSPGIGAA